MSERVERANVRLFCSTAIALLIPLWVACGSDGEEGSTASPPTVSATSTPAAPPSLKSVSMLAGEVAELIDESDESGLRNLMAAQMLPCVAEDSGVAGPFCGSGFEVGTPVEAAFTAGCQGGWTTDVDNLAATIISTAGAPLGLAELEPRNVDWPGDVPYGETVLVFSPSGSDVTASVALFLDADQVVRTQVGCKRAEDFLLDRTGASLHILWRAS